ncbi:MAG TPA: dockerin type I domain-containing protein [Pirellulales bacterium]|nr:dockerin type I domain-containing protein [Pirellulales bacterium]
MVQPSQGAFTYDEGDNTSWWYDNVNWSSDTLPNTGTGAAMNSATEVDNGYGVNQTTGVGDGVVFDPTNDPNYLANAGTPPYVTPYQLGRFYLGNQPSGANPPANYNTLTVKSGELDLASQMRIARTDLSSMSETVTGTIVQTGGTVNLQDTNNDAYLSLGDTTHTLGIYNYSGGTLLFQTPSTSTSSSPGVRLGNVLTATGKFIDRNTGAAGAIQLANMYVGYNGIGILEYHYGLDQSSHGDVRPIQIVGTPFTGESSNGQLALRNGVSDGMTPLTQASELSLVLDAAPTVVGGIPQSLGLVSFVSGASGIKGLSTNPKIFYATDGITPYIQGSTISATFGGNTYDWTISYSGSITYSNAATSAISMISGNGGTDIVLIGESVASNILLGDMNFDGHVDAKDIAALEAALTNPSGYLSTDFGYGTPASHGVTTSNMGQYADVSGNGKFDNADLQALLKYLKGGHGSLSSVVPEPASIILAGIGFALVGCTWRRRRTAV